jgi:hypothetical protein
MKKFLILSLMFATIATLVIPTVTHTNDAKAQIVRTLTPAAAKDTLTNGDTAYIYLAGAVGATGSVTTNVLESDGRSVEAYLKKVSGTPAGSVALEGTVDGTNWKQISTDTFTNTTTQIFVYDVRSSASTSMIYKQYRLVFITSGTVVCVPKAYVLRRQSN